LGYMFLAVGVGAYTAGIFHLMTHAFFKGLLFLGAGRLSSSKKARREIKNDNPIDTHATRPTAFLPIRFPINPLIKNPTKGNNGTR